MKSSVDCRWRLQKTAAEIYGAAKEAKTDHPYLAKKRISPSGGIRQTGGQLFVPVYVEDKLTSLQFIEEDGTKRFLSGGEIKGGCCLLGTPGEVICIAEGYATGCSIHEATSLGVFVAFNAGNLVPVAQAIRQRYKERDLILCADNDQWTEGNPGLTKATEAALAVGGQLAVPDFLGCDMSSRPTDFNDLHVLSGKEAVNQAIAAAKKVGDATQPVSDPPLLPHRKPSEGPESGGNVAGADGDFHSPSEPDVEAATDAETLETGKTAEAVGAVTPISGTRPQVIGKEDAFQDDESIAPLAPPRMPDTGVPPLIQDIVEAACNSMRSPSCGSRGTYGELLWRDDGASGFPAYRRFRYTLPALPAYRGQKRKGTQGYGRIGRTQDI